MKRFCCLILLFASIATAQSNRKSVYPIILVHGLVGSDGTFYKLMQQYQQTGYNVSIDHSRLNYGLTGGAGVGSRIDFNLNADGLISRANTDFIYKQGKYNFDDVVDLQSPIDANNDVFVMNFNTANYSNQSAIYKQGFALGIAIQKVLAATKAEKVILIGHSMGGLAIREYLQNSRFLFYDNNATHKVYRVVTIGTPHGGSNTGSGDLNAQALIKSFYQKFVDERSEAVRDLRTNHTASNQPGVYLFGGSERDATYGISGIGYNNTDINCNGKTDDVGGLNKAKSGLLPTEIYYECIVSEVGNIGSDFVVTTTSQNLNNFIKKQVDGNNYDMATLTKIKNVAHVPLLGYEGESEQAPTLIRSAMLTINVPIAPKNYMVFMTGSFYGGFTDAYASYFVDIPAKGILTIGYTAVNGVFTKMLLQKDNAVGAYIINAPQTNAYTTELEKGRYLLTLYAQMNFDGYSTASLTLNFKPDVVITNTNNAVENMVFPNPTRGYLSIKSDIMKPQIECYNLIGQSIPFKVESDGIFIEEKGFFIVRVDNHSHRVLVE
jgi:pimeloyl-ACP methyl ester carboxylesterase